MCRESKPMVAKPIVANKCSYLYSLEQEVNSLRAQVAALTSADTIGQTKRGIAAGAAHAVTGVRPEMTIDPSLQGEGGDGPLRSPWDSPGFQGSHYRRPSDNPVHPSPLGESPRSPFPTRPHPTGQLAGVHATSLTRMVHDAALRTGHAQNHAAVLNPPGPSSVAGSEFGSNDSPGIMGEGDEIAAQDVPTPRTAMNGSRRPPMASPLGTGSSSSGKPKRRAFAVPPLPPQPAVERLVAAYVDFVGVSAPIVHIPSLGKQLIKIREGRDVEQSDVFVVMMVLGERQCVDFADDLALSTMASSRFVDPPDELRACSEAFHAEAMKHLDAVFEEQSYGKCLSTRFHALGLTQISRPASDSVTRLVFPPQPG